MTNLKAFTFSKGAHKTRDEGMCVMEAVAYLAGEPHSDAPQCACPVITRLAIWLNDTADDALRQKLLCDLPWRIVGTRSPAHEQQRSYMAADWAVREIAPHALRVAGLIAEAERLERLPAITDQESAAHVAHAAAIVAGAAARAADVAARTAHVDQSQIIHRSCARLLDRMIRLTEPQEHMVIARAEAMGRSRE